MLECRNCESAQFLNIKESRVLIESKDEISEMELQLECTFCDSEGDYWICKGIEGCAGDIVVSSEKPRMDH